MLWTLEKARANVVERAVVLTEPPADLGMKSSRKGQCYQKMGDVTIKYHRACYQIRHVQK